MYLLLQDTIKDIILMAQKSWVVQSDSTVAQPFIKKFEALHDKLQSEMTVGENISTTSGLGNFSKSSNRDPGLNQASNEGSDFESEANSCPDSPGEQKTKENEPPSKMQKIDPTNSGTGTLHLNQTTKLYIISEGTKYNAKHRIKHEKHDEYVGKDIDIGGCQQENRPCSCKCSVRS